MMTQHFGFSIVTAPLAAVDRRSLSQAWYSALRLAREPQARVESARTTATNVSRDLAKRHPAPRDGSRTIGGGQATSPRHLLRRAEVLTYAGPDRRADRSALARKIERAFLDPRREVRQATFALEGSAARVHIALHTSGDHVRLCAVCPPSLRRVVGDALAQARFALSTRGIDLTIDTREASAC
jgi:hypothetical protein